MDFSERACRRGFHQALELAADLIEQATTLQAGRRRLVRAAMIAQRLRDDSAHGHLCFMDEVFGRLPGPTPPRAEGPSTQLGLVGFQDQRDDPTRRRLSIDSMDSTPDHSKRSGAILGIPTRPTQEYHVTVPKPQRRGDRGTGPAIGNSAPRGVGVASLREVVCELNYRFGCATSSRLFARGHSANFQNLLHDCCHAGSEGQHTVRQLRRISRLSNQIIVTIRTFTSIRPRGYNFQRPTNFAKNNILVKRASCLT